MALRCGCPAEGDEIVFGPAHECGNPKPRCECGFPFGAKTCPVHAQPLDPPRLVPSWVFTVPAGEPAERPFETTLSDGDGDLG